MTKKIASIVTAAVLALGLSACSAVPAAEQGERSGYLAAYVVNLPDGGTVVCISSIYDNVGGIDCDWEGTRND